MLRDFNNSARLAVLPHRAEHFLHVGPHPDPPSRKGIMAILAVGRLPC
jgi:hypothetical protein